MNGDIEEFSDKVFYLTAFVLCTTILVLGVSLGEAKRAALACVVVGSPLIVGSALLRHWWNVRRRHSIAGTKQDRA